MDRNSKGRLKTKEILCDRLEKYQKSNLSKEENKSKKPIGLSTFLG